MRRASPSRARYRVRQVLRGLRPGLSPEEAALVRARLSDAELRLFMGSMPRDRRHSMDLFHLLAGQQPPPSEDLLTAALLHDVGKGPLALWHRVLFVMLDALAPRLARRVEAEAGTSWRRALWRLRHHARLGAELLSAAGASPRVVEIVAAHTDATSDDPDVLAFILADDQV